jgi:hypothetical protein
MHLALAFGLLFILENKKEKKLEIQNTLDRPNFRTQDLMQAWRLASQTTTLTLIIIIQYDFGENLNFTLT